MSIMAFIAFAPPLNYLLAPSYGFPLKWRLYSHIYPGCKAMFTESTTHSDLSDQVAKEFLGYTRTLDRAKIRSFEDLAQLARSYCQKHSGTKLEMTYRCPGLGGWNGESKSLTDVCATP